MIALWIAKFPPLILNFSKINSGNKSHAEQVMRLINVEITMGLSASYYKPTKKEVLEDYKNGKFTNNQ